MEDGGHQNKRKNQTMGTVDVSKNRDAEHLDVEKQSTVHNQ